jgi:hypothetical protein
MSADAIMKRMQQLQMQVWSFFDIFNSQLMVFVTLQGYLKTDKSQLFQQHMEEECKADDAAAGKQNIGKTATNILNELRPRN